MPDSYETAYATACDILNAQESRSGAARPERLSVVIYRVLEAIHKGEEHQAEKQRQALVRLLEKGGVL